ncbi:alpha/beta hydrolase fold domain-containing protein [Streptomyces canus]|uniref:alpha/beta hydrolase fold domain-containing protein n=1 Tax=Streptomyces canus TaxID=58343 RepID=UPI0033B6CFDC
MGDSVGGGIAAAVSILARERGRPADRRPDPHHADARRPHHHPRSTHRALCAVVLPRQPHRMADPARRGRRRARRPGHGGPARLEDATGLPSAYIEVCRLDVFRDEATAYATKLSRVGVPVEFHLHPGAPHEFNSIAFTSDVARRAITDRIRILI